VPAAAAAAAAGHGFVGGRDELQDIANLLADSNSILATRLAAIDNSVGGIAQSLDGIKAAMLALHAKDAAATARAETRENLKKFATAATGKTDDDEITKLLEKYQLPSHMREMFADLTMYKIKDDKKGPGKKRKAAEASVEPEEDESEDMDPETPYVLCIFCHRYRLKFYVGTSMLPCLALHRITSADSQAAPVHVACCS